MSNAISGQAVVRLDRDSADRVVAALIGSSSQVAQVAERLAGIGLGDFAPLFLRWSDGTRECAAAVSVAVDETEAADRIGAAAVSGNTP